MNLRGSAIAAELTWTDGRFERGVTVRVSADGAIASVDRGPPPANAVRLARRALLPGFVNAHSHAFQRGLRPTTQRFDAGAGNFWTWRETMYRLADALDVDGFYDASLRAFREMLAAGMTTVGEFHYLHHAGESCDDWAFDDAILSAAADAGIRLVLIQTYYATGNVGRPLEGAQRRFGPVSREAFARQLDRLASKLRPGPHTLALACHSIRAVRLDDLKFFRDMALRNGWPFHIHVEEVRKEIEDCLAAYGRGPLATLLDTVAIDPSVTAIHCTHSTPADLKEYLARGGGVCLCPITEGNLSDGFPDLPFIREAGGRVCFGTDCNIRLCAAEELRWMEFAQRLRRERRGVVTDGAGRCAAALLEVGTINGAASLGLNAGRIAPGAAADLFTLNLDDPALSDSDDAALLDAFLFGCGNAPIREVFVGGVAVPRANSGTA